MSCAIEGCKSHSGRKENCPDILTFHRFPKDEEYKNEWIRRVARKNWTWKTHSHICSKHFTPESFLPNKSIKWRRLKENALPTLYLSYSEPTATEELGCMDVEVEQAQFPSDATAGASSHYSSTSISKDSMATAALQYNIMDVSVTEKAQFLSDSAAGANINISVLKDSTNFTHSMNIVENASATSACCFESKNKMRLLEQELEKTKKLCRKRLLKINALRKQTKRLKQKNVGLNERLQEILNEENLEQDKLLILDAVKNNKVIERYLSKQLGEGNKTYDLEIKKFAVTLHYLSPRAYNFVREQLDNILPHAKTIGKWYQGINCDPGFTTEAFDALKMRVDSNEGKPIYGALSMDEMAIRKLVEWDGTNYFGFVNMGCELNSDAVPLAREALTFMLTSVNDTWKIPVGYFLINCITAHEKATLVQQCLSLLKETGVTVVSLTFDGATTNKAMCKDLGCDMSSQLFYFNDNGHSVCIWPDPCHNIKLVRNTFAEKKEMVDIQGRKIDWQLIELLNQLQNEEGLHLANKLKRDHINFVKQKMKVRLATQLMSNSVADALEYCQVSGIPGFSDCGGTIGFIRIFNNLFDVLNTRSIRAKGWKRATACFNIEETELFFETAIQYISELKFCNGNKVINSNRSTGFLGFIICMKSLLHLYKSLIETENATLKYICTYKLNQDHIELFFGAIRSRCGFNNNPSARMFRAAYKKLIVHAEFKESAKGNCLPLEEIKILNYSPQKFCKMLNNCTVYSRTLTKETSLLDEYYEIHGHDYIYDPTALTEFARDVINYIAGFVVRTLKKKLNCETCLKSLENKENDNLLIAIKDRGGLIKPSRSVFRVCEITEKVLREHKLKIQANMLGLPKHMTHMIFKVSNSFLMNSYGFSDLKDHEMDNFFTENHRVLLIKTIAQNYLNIRIHYITKNLYDQEKIRSFLTKTVIFKGQ